MIVKKAGGKVYGAIFTAAEKKAMDMEINRQIIEADRRYTDDITLWFSIPSWFTLDLALSGYAGSMRLFQ